MDSNSVSLPVRFVKQVLSVVMLFTLTIFAAMYVGLLVGIVIDTAQRVIS